MIRKHFAAIACAGIFLATSLSLSAQTVEMKNVVVTHGNRDFMSKKLGTEVKFDLEFTDLDQPSHYKMYWKLVDKDGNVVLNSRLATRINDKYKTVYPMAEGDLHIAKFRKIFLQYGNIQADAGKQELDLVLSLDRTGHNLPDFKTYHLSFDMPDVKAKPFAEQTFELRNLKVGEKYGTFGNKEQGLEASFDLYMDYGQDQIDESKYTVTWSWTNASGVELFNSVDAVGLQNRHKMVYMHTLEKSGKGFVDHQMRLFTNYRQFPVEGTHDLALVVMISTDDHQTRKIIAKTVKATIPVKYEYDEQTFGISNFTSLATKKDGVSGVQFTFDYSLKFSSINLPADQDIYYYVYVELMDGQEHKFTPRFPAHIVHYTTDHHFPIKATPENQTGTAKLFIPYYRIDAKAGKQELTVDLQVSDKLGQVRFMPLKKGVPITIDKPATKTARIMIENLKVTPGNYDTQIIFGSNQPDLQWILAVGRDHSYSSARRKNSLYGASEVARIKYCDGDQISLKVYDDDRGLFNRDDLIETIMVNYKGKAGKFTEKIAAQGQIERVEISFENL